MQSQTSSATVIPKLWYFCHFSALSCLFPYFNLYFRRLGLSESQIGLLTAFRPWVSFPAGSAWSGAADKLRAHRVVLLILFSVSTVSRLSMAAASSFGLILVLVLATEFFSAAITIIADAAVTAACTQDGEYGRQRLFGAIGWGIFSAVVGIVVSQKGIYAAFVCHAILSSLEILPTTLLPFGPLHAKLDGGAPGTNAGQEGTSDKHQCAHNSKSQCVQTQQQVCDRQQQLHQQQQPDLQPLALELSDLPKLSTRATGGNAQRRSSTLSSVNNPKTCQERGTVCGVAPDQSRYAGTNPLGRVSGDVALAEPEGAMLIPAAAASPDPQASQNGGSTSTARSAEQSPTWSRHQLKSGCVSVGYSIAAPMMSMQMDSRPCGESVCTINMRDGNDEEESAECLEQAPLFGSGETTQKGALCMIVSLDHGQHAHARRMLAGCEATALCTSSSQQQQEEEEEEEEEILEEVASRSRLLEPDQQPVKDRHQSRTNSRDVKFWHGIRQLLQNPQALLFFGLVTVMGFGVGNIEGYLFLYLDELGGSEALMGISLSITCAAEILVFWYSGKFIQSLGAKRCLHLVFVAFLIRLVCYATLAWWGNPWKVLPVELLHGFTFALAWGTGTAYSSQIAPPGLEATTQALFQGLYFGVGYGIGGLVGGIIYQSHGAQEVYWVAFAVMATGWIAGCAVDWHISSWIGQNQYDLIKSVELAVEDKCNDG